MRRDGDGTQPAFIMALSAGLAQGLRSLEMINVVGAYPTETEEFLGGMRGLTRLVVCNNTAAVKMAPMHCLASMPLLQVPRCAARLSAAIS